MIKQRIDVPAVMLPHFFLEGGGGSDPSVDACIYSSILRIPQATVE
jgi:hypothetical protein